MQLKAPALQFWIAYNIFINNIFMVPRVVEQTQWNLAYSSTGRSILSSNDHTHTHTDYNSHKIKAPNTTNLMNK